MQLSSEGIGHMNVVYDKDRAYPLYIVTYRKTRQQRVGPAALLKQTLSL